MAKPWFTAKASLLVAALRSTLGSQTSLLSPHEPEAPDHGLCEARQVLREMHGCTAFPYGGPVPETCYTAMDERQNEMNSNKPTHPGDNPPVHKRGDLRKALSQVRCKPQASESLVAEYPAFVFGGLGSTVPCHVVLTDQRMIFSDQNMDGSLFREISRSELQAATLRVNSGDSLTVLPEGRGKPLSICLADGAREALVAAMGKEMPEKDGLGDALRAVRGIMIWVGPFVLWMGAGGYLQQTPEHFRYFMLGSILLGSALLGIFLGKLGVAGAFVFGAICTAIGHSQGNLSLNFAVAAPILMALSSLLAGALATKLKGRS